MKFLLGANKIRLDWVNELACPTIEVKSLLLPLCIGGFICGHFFDLTQILNTTCLDTLFQLTNANAAGPWEIRPVAEDTGQAALDSLLHSSGASTGKVAIMIAGALLLAILLTKAAVQGFG